MITSPGRNAFLIHLAVYVVVCAILLAINAGQTTGPGEGIDWWVLWVDAGWGIGLAAHGFAEWAQRRSSRGGLLADPDIRGVAVHLFLYLGMNAFLIALNLAKTPEALWSVWPLLGWGLGLAGHAWIVYRAALRKTVEHYATEQRVLTEMQLEARAAQIAAAIDKPEKKKTPPTRKRRQQAVAKTTKKRAARSGSAVKRVVKHKPKGRKR